MFVFISINPCLSPSSSEKLLTKQLRQSLRIRKSTKSNWWWNIQPQTVYLYHSSQSSWKGFHRRRVKKNVRARGQDSVPGMDTFWAPQNCFPQEILKLWIFAWDLHQHWPVIFLSIEKVTEGLPLPERLVAANGCWGRVSLHWWCSCWKVVCAPECNLSPVII